MAALDNLIVQAREQRASDVHIAPGVPVRFRVDGSLVDANDHVLQAEDCRVLAEEAAGDLMDALGRTGELDLAVTFSGDIRCRINIFMAQGAPCLAIRLLAPRIPKLETLGLPEVVNEFSRYNKGIVLVTGETGSGKSTTLAAIIDDINHTRREHVITLEDPVEYVYTPDLCSIDQREVGKDTQSFDDGLRASLREDPDIILVGEMRDLSTIETALTAAETGHLVFGTLHTQSASDSVDRLVGVFPPERQAQIRMQLSMTLRAVISQQLLVRAGGEGRSVACEVMIVNPAIQNLIREGKTPQIKNTLATSAELGSVTMDNYLLKMEREGLIDHETAVQAAHDREFVSHGGMGSLSTGVMGSSRGTTTGMMGSSRGDTVGGGAGTTGMMGSSRRVGRRGGNTRRL